MVKGFMFVHHRIIFIYSHIVIKGSNLPVMDIGGKHFMFSTYLTTFSVTIKLAICII